MMRIAFVFFDGVQRFKGPGVNVSRLLPELVRRGHEVHGLCMKHENDPVLSEHLESEGINVHMGSARLGLVKNDIRWILRKVYEIQPDIFIGNLWVAAWYASRWIKKAGIPTIACHRSDDSFHWAMVDRFVVGAEQWRVSGVACVSQSLQERMVAIGGDAVHSRTIPSGVPVPVESANHDDRGLRLIYAGRLSQKQKRIIDLFDAVEPFLLKHPESQFTIIGDGPEKPALCEAVLNSPVKKQVYLKDAVEPWEIQNELHKHEVAILLSDYEGTPGAVMDAMACGLVPVCLDIEGGVRDLVRHEETGLLVSDRGSDFLAKLEMLHENIPLRTTMSKNAKQHIQKHFSLQLAADAWEEFTTQLIRENSCPKRALKVPLMLRLPPPHPAFGTQDMRRVKKASVKAWRISKASQFYQQGWNSDRCKVNRGLSLVAGALLQPSRMINYLTNAED